MDNIYLSFHQVLRDDLNDVVVLPQDPNIVELGIRTVRHDLTLDPYQGRYSQMRVDMPELEQVRTKSLIGLYLYISPGTNKSILEIDCGLPPVTSSISYS
jgi:hypothetical protein